MSLPVITDTFRCTLNYSSHAGVSPVNVIHVGSTTLDVAGVGALLAGAGVDNMLGPVSGYFEPTSWTVLPLDGGSASQVFARTDGNQMAGQGTSNDSILELANIVSFRSAVGGPRGRNRIFVGPITENTQAEGILSLIHI